jgi:Flp pilus assembly pilin Flp
MKRQLSALGTLFVRMARDERGGETLEYAMTLGFLALASYVLVSMVGMKFVDFWHRIDRTLAQLG